MRLSHVVVAALSVGLMACSSGGEGGSAPQPSTESGPPLDFPLDRRDVPSPGLCRVWIVGNPASQQFLQRSCDGIENTAPIGEYIMFRPQGQRVVHVCLMSSNTVGVVDGIDAFDIDRMRLVRVILPRQRRTEDDTVPCSWEGEG